MLETFQLSWEDVIDRLDCGILILDPELRVEYANKMTMEIWGFDQAYVSTKPLMADLIRRYSEEEFFDLTENHQNAWIKQRIHMIRAKDGSFQEFSFSNGLFVRSSVIGLADDRRLLTYHDITELKQREQDIKSHAETLEVVQESVEQGLTWFGDDLRLRAFNGKMVNLLDFPPELFRVGEPMEVFFRYNAERGEYGDGDVDQIVAEKMELVRRFEPHEFERTRVDGTVVQIRGTVVPQGGFVTTYTDVTEKRRYQSEIEYLAHHDVLTGLQNRASFNEGLRLSMDEASANNGLSALMVLDLDHFKQVNDTLGHPVGDQLLIAFCERVKTCLAAHEAFYRLGGDEFAVVFSRLESMQRCQDVGDGFFAAVQEPFQIQGNDVRIGVSAGAAIFDPKNGGMSGDELLRRADVALYAAKKDERGSLAFFGEK